MRSDEIIMGGNPAKDLRVVEELKRNTQALREAQAAEAVGAVLHNSEEDLLYYVTTSPVPEAREDRSDFIVDM